MSEYDVYKAWWADTGEPVAAEEWAAARALRSGKTALGELLRIQRFDGTFRTIRNSALPLYDERGDRVGAIAVNEDITDLKEAEEALRRAVQAREEMLGVVAHDLRAPLSAISLHLQRLRRRGGEPERRDQRPVEVIVRQVERMGHLLQDLLDLGRIDAGTLDVERDRVPAEKLLAEGMEALAPVVAAASLELHVEVRGPLPEVWADREQIVRVLDNLVSNACKFTGPGGRVTVGAAPRGAEILFWVEDTGPGIPAESIGRVFDRFWQVDRRDRRGAGLGLAIVKGIVEAHGGHARAESRAGEGATFFFTLPIADPAAPVW